MSGNQGGDKEKNSRSFLKHPLVIAMVPILGSLIGFLWVNLNKNCPRITEISTSNLIAIENRLYPDGIKEKGINYNKDEKLYGEIWKSNKFEEANEKRDELLGNYFKVNNSEILEHVEEIRRKIPKKESFYSVSYIYGAAGVGKSFIKKPISEFFGDDQCLVDLNKRIRVGKKYGSYIKQKPQLYSGKFVLGELPNIEEPGSFSLKDLLKDCECFDNERVGWKKVIIIDDLDEIHPESSMLLLELIDDLITEEKTKNPFGFLSIFILGRPEAFSLWLSDSHHKYPDNFSQYSLKGPGYDSLSDVELMALNYFMFVEHKMPSQAIIAKVRDEFSTKPFLFYSAANNLSNSNYAIKHAALLSSSSEYEYKEKLFSDYIARNSGTHNRPKRTEEKGELYERLLQNIAAKHFDSTDHLGYFKVNINESMCVVRKSKDKSLNVLGDIENCDVDMLSFNVQQTLEYSGIVSIEPINDKIKRYRFNPFWIHRYLVEKRNDRNNAR